MEYITSGIFSIHGVADSGIGGRPENQDDFGFYDTPLGFLAVVCDGMGGGPGGKTASYIAKYVIAHFLTECNPDMPRDAAFKSAVAKAHASILQKMMEVPSLKGMGSTFVAVLINKNSAIIAHAGDSRCYIFRGKKCIYQSKDHSLVAELVRNKALTEEEARTSPQSNIITRGLGSVSNNVAEIDEVHYKKGDRFVLCTDGIWGAMKADELKKRLSQKGNHETIVTNLSNEVDNIGNQSGGYHDNHTIIMCDIDIDSAASGGFSDRKILGYSCIAGVLMIGLLCYYIFFLRKPDVPDTVDSTASGVSDMGAHPLNPGGGKYPVPDSPVDVDGVTLPGDTVRKSTEYTPLDSLRKEVSEGRKDNGENRKKDKDKKENCTLDKDKGGKAKSKSNGRTVINTPVEAIDSMKRIAQKVLDLKALTTKDGVNELETLKKQAKELLNSTILKEALSGDKMKSHRQNLTSYVNEKWNIDKTFYEEKKYAVAPGTRKLMEEKIIPLLDTVKEELSKETNINNSH